VYFKHNDMESLRNTLEKVTAENERAKKLRRYIVVEAVYQVNSLCIMHIKISPLFSVFHMIIELDFVNKHRRHLDVLALCCMLQKMLVSPCMV